MDLASDNMTLVDLYDFFEQQFPSVLLLFIFFTLMCDRNNFKSPWSESHLEAAVFIVVFLKKMALFSGYLNVQIVR